VVKILKRLSLLPMSIEILKVVMLCLIEWCVLMVDLWNSKISSVNCHERSVVRGLSWVVCCGRSVVRDLS
jgi:hypothetical protein